MSEALREDLPETRPGGTGLATFALVLTGVIQLLLVAVLTRTLSKTEFAALSLVVLASTTISAVAPLGVPTALTVFLPRRDPASARALGMADAKARQQKNMQLQVPTRCRGLRGRKADPCHVVRSRRAV